GDLLAPRDHHPGTPHAQLPARTGLNAPPCRGRTTTRRGRRAQAAAFTNSNTTEGEPTMTQMTTNGRPRKQLSEQIDRLERAVGGLGLGLREAVREATTQAVGELVAEVVTNPDVAAFFRNAQAQPAQAARPRPSPGGGLLGRLADWFQQPLQVARQAWQ